MDGLVNKTDHPLEVFPDLPLFFFIKMKPAQISKVGDQFVIDYHGTKIAELAFNGH
jgi:hypothetical protein